MTGKNVLSVITCSSKLLQTDLIHSPFTSAMANTLNLQSKLHCLTLMSVNLRGLDVHARFFSFGSYQLIGRFTAFMEHKKVITGLCWLKTRWWTSTLSPDLYIWEHLVPFSLGQYVYVFKNFIFLSSKKSLKVLKNVSLEP